MTHQPYHLSAGGFIVLAIFFFTLGVIVSLFVRRVPRKDGEKISLIRLHSKPKKAKPKAEEDDEDAPQPAPYSNLPD